MRGPAPLGHRAALLNHANLEHELQTELQVASTLRCVDDPRLRAAEDVDGISVDHQNRSVKRVDGLRAEFQVLAFLARQAELLAETQVDLLQARASLGADAASRRQRLAGDEDGTCSRRRCSGRPLEDIGRRRGHRSRSMTSGHLSSSP